MKERNSNIELLRLLCIVMIISMHVFGLYDDNLNIAGLAALSFNNAVCNMGVSIFMLISGYYGIRYKTDKLLSLWNIALFWSLALIFVDADHSAKNIVRSLFPVFTGKYWFLTSYIIIFCLSSYIEKLIHILTKKQFLILIGVLLLFFVIAPSFFMFEILHDSGKGIMNMFTVYLIGRYLSIFGLTTKINGLTGVGIVIFCVIIIAGIDFIVQYRIGVPFQMLARDNSILIVLGSVVVFTKVITIKPRTIKWINQLASYVFPIYVTHGVLITRLIFFPESMHHLLYLMVWLNTLAVFVASISIETIRRLMLAKPFDRLLKTEMVLMTKAIDFLNGVVKRI